VHARDIDVEPVACAVCGADDGTPVASGRDYLHHTSEQEYTFAQCKRCGHIYLNPRPVFGEIERIYPAAYATYTKRFGGSDSVLATLKDRVLLARFDAFSDRLHARMRLIDVGCGDGRFLMALRKRFPEAELTGLDWHFGPQVQQELQACGIGTIVGAIEDADLAERHYDVITMNQIIEHVWDVRLVLERCRRALAAGGLLALETPNPDGWDRRFFRRGAWGGYYWPRHLNLFTRGNLSRLVRESGMEVILTQPLLAPPCWIYSVQFSAQRLGLGAWFAKVFPDTSTPLLAVFALVDRIALLVGAETSNQKLVAKRMS
jgi:2-polyprenyl-3-methyl-5-hydroxy-6-metoxy-1,4-benzoquinol methylase